MGGEENDLTESIDRHLNLEDLTHFIICVQCFANTSMPSI